ncbi:retrovirus-related pol polyprotein from transposon TNT 1-94 [Tanacetum coccineum]
MSYHKLFDVLKQYQKEVNEIHAERIAKNTNPLAFVVVSQQYLDPYYQAPKSHRSLAQPSKQSSSTRSNATAKYKGKEIAKPNTPPSESAFKEDSDPEQAQKDKDMQMNLAFIAKYFKKIYKPTNNNLRTSSNSRNKNVDSSSRVKDYSYHKKKMLMCKQAEKGVSLQAEQADWLADTDEEIGEQELETHYSYMAKIQEVLTADSGTDTEPLEQADSNVIPDSPDMCDDDIQNDQNAEDERTALANLISNLTLNTKENKKILKQLKIANTSLTQELKECKYNLEESNTTRDSCLIALQHKQTELEKYMTFNDRTIDYDKLEQKHLISLDLALQQCQEQMKNDTVCKEKASNLFLKEREQYFEIQYLKAQLQDKNIAISGLKKLIQKCKGKSMETKFDKPSVVRKPNAQRILKPSVLGKLTPFSDSLERKSFSKTKSVPKTNVLECLSKPVTTYILPQTARQAIRNINVIKQGMYQIDTRTTQSRAPQLPQTSRNTNPRVSTSTGLNHRTNFKSRTSNVNDVCATYGKCVFNSNYDACVSKFLNDMNARTKKPKVVPINLVQGNVMINRVYYVKGLNHNLFSVGQFGDADLEVVFQKSTCFVRDPQRNDLLTGNHGSDLYTISLQETTSSTPICFMDKASPTQAWLWHRILSHLNFDYINLLSKNDIVIRLPKLKYVKDQLCSSCEVSKEKRSSFNTKVVPSLKGRLNLLHMDLCGSMRVASINGKKYILVIVDDYSRYTWTLFLRSNDETAEVLKHFRKMIQQNLQAQNGIFERRNCTLVEAARSMLSASKLLLFFWAEAIATACYTQNRSIIMPTHEKTAYHIINDIKPLIRHLHIFGCTCYLTRDGENLDKMKEKGDPCILIVAASYGTVLASCQQSTLCVIKYCVSELSFCAGALSNLFLASELSTLFQRVTTSELQLSSLLLESGVLSLKDGECKLNVWRYSDFSHVFDLVTDFASWQQRIRLYCWGKENGVNILKSIDEGPFQMGTFRETLAEGNEGALHLGPERPRVYSNLSPEDKGKHKGETIYDYYVRFTKLINDMRNINTTMSRMQLNSKFVNNMLPEWGRFVTTVKLNRGLRDSDYDQLVDRIEDRVTMHGVQGQLVMRELITELGMLIQVKQGMLSATTAMDLALNVDNVFQADDCDAFDSDVNEAAMAQTMFMANLSSADPVYDEAGPSYDSNILSEVHDHDHYQDAVCEHHEEHEMHDDYVKDNAVPVVQSNVSSVPNDAYMIIFNDMHEPHA